MAGMSPENSTTYRALIEPVLEARARLGEADCGRGEERRTAFLDEIREPLRRVPRGGVMNAGETAFLPCMTMATRR
jgi:hypothetical protein